VKKMNGHLKKIFAVLLAVEDEFVPADAEYTVNHYLKNLNGEGYDQLIESEDMVGVKNSKRDDDVRYRHQGVRRPAADRPQRHSDNGAGNYPYMMIGSAAGILAMVLGRKRRDMARRSK